MFQFPWFPLIHLSIQCRVVDLLSTGLPHSDISGSKVACHLPEAYRRLLRPSSALQVKASTMRLSSI